MATGQGGQAGARAALIPIIDTHLHLVAPERFSYPWLADAPAINRPWTMDAYWAEAEPLGIAAALHMEVDVADADSVAESTWAARLPHIAGVVAACRPEAANFGDQLETLLAIPALRGVRRILHQAPDALSQTDLFADNLRHLAQHDLTFDLCVRADQLALGQSLADQAPDTVFVLDHCGVPDITGTGLDPWRAAISAIAERPNVNAKLSGIAAYAGPGWTPDTLRPYVEHIIASFGWDRVVWGSDHPVVTLTGSLTSWVDATRQLIAGASPEEQAKLLHRNAGRIYRLEEA